MEAGLAAVKPWLPLSVMAEAVQKTVEDAGFFSVVREYGGHGIGKEFHEDPFVGFTTEAPDVDTIMAPGMVFTIEPMVNAGAPDIKISKGDGWCVRTKDGSDSAQCEGTARGDRGWLRAAELVAVGYAGLRDGYANHRVARRFI